MRVVIDTNVVVSGMFFGRLPHELLQLVIKKKINAVTSNQIIAEYHSTVSDILRQKKYMPKEEVTVNDLINEMELITPTSQIKVCRDPKDDMFIACAIDGKCKYIVSGDKDLLDLEAYGNVEIVTVREFMDEYNAAQ